MMNSVIGSVAFVILCSLLGLSILTILVVFLPPRSIFRKNKVYHSIETYHSILDALVRNEIIDFYYVNVTTPALTALYTNEEIEKNKFDRRPKVAIFFDRERYCLIIPQFTYRNLKKKSYKAYKFNFQPDVDGMERYLNVEKMFFLSSDNVRKSKIQSLDKLDEIRSGVDLMKKKFCKSCRFAHYNDLEQYKILEKSWIVCQEELLLN